MDEQSEAVQKAITEIGDEAGTLDADPQVLIAAGKAIEQLELDKAELVQAVNKFMEESESWEGHPTTSDVYPNNGDSMKDSTIAFMSLYESIAKHTPPSDSEKVEFCARCLKRVDQCGNCNQAPQAASDSEIVDGLKAVRMWIGGEMNQDELLQWETIQKAGFCDSIDKAISALPSTDSVTISRELFNELVYEIPKAKNALAGAAHPYPSPYKEDLERLVLELEQALEAKPGRDKNK
jgi:hypothetical protein